MNGLELGADAEDEVSEDVERTQLREVSTPITDLYLSKIKKEAREFDSAYYNEKVVSALSSPNSDV